MTGLSTNQLQDQSEDPDIHPDLQHLVANSACCRIWYCTDCVYLLIIWYRNRYGVILSRWTVISVRECRWFFLNKGGSRRSESCGPQVVKDTVTPKQESLKCHTQDPLALALGLLYIPGTLQAQKHRYCGPGNIKRRAGE